MARRKPARRAETFSMEDRQFRYVSRPTLFDEGFNEDVDLPFDLQVAEVREALEEVYDFLRDINYFLASRGYDRLEEIILGNSLSGFISELVVKRIGANSETLARNEKIGGHPDLIPRDKYPDNAALRAEDGIEVKTSIQSGGWQGHNPERSWVMVVQYSVDALTEPVQERRPSEILKVMCALLDEEDWSFSGRVGASRRTPTASILKSGTAKLHANAIYEHPRYVRNQNRMRAELDALRLTPEQYESPD
ncbi:MAG TPA: hypothetical protein VMS11_11220 [Solirubrobacterales bacterium]|nr:hypothetical protein [Solirubrobacterales bacterium]